MDKAANDIKRIVDYFKGREEVSALYIFGSASKGRQTDESDIDIAVLVDESKLGKKNFELLKRDYYKASPYFSMRPVDIVILNAASSFLKHRIIKTGSVLFERNRKQRVRFTTNALVEYLDFKPIEDIFIKAMRRRLREGTFGR